MRERRRLEEAINATRAIERELADTAELIEMAEAEGDDAMVDEGVRSLAELAERAERDKVAALLAGEADANNSLHRGQCRRRRHREPGLGRDAAAHVHPLGRAPRNEGRADRPSFGRAGGHQVGDDPGQGRERLRQSEDRKRRPPAGADQPLRFQRAAPHQLLERVGLSGGRRRHRHRGQRSRSAHRHLSRVGRGRAARQHHRQRGAHHARSDGHRRRLPEPALAAQEPRRRR